jgi:hypothetical protein
VDIAKRKSQASVSETIFAVSLALDLNFSLFEVTSHLVLSLLGGRTNNWVASKSRKVVVLSLNRAIKNV